LFPTEALVLVSLGNRVSPLVGTAHCRETLAFHLSIHVPLLTLIYYQSKKGFFMTEPSESELLNDLFVIDELADRQ
jgi:hypothetical protein